MIDRETLLPRSWTTRLRTLGPGRANGWALGVGLTWLAAAGCSPPTQPAVVQPTGPSISLAGVELSTPTEQPFPLGARTAGGHSFTLTEPATRTLAGNAAVLDYFALLGAEAALLASAERAPEHSIAAARGASFDGLERIAKLDTESVIGLGPDLVVVHGWQPIEQKVQWRRAGLALVELPDVTSFADTLEALDLLARLTDTTDSFAPRRAELLARATRLGDRAAGAGQTALAYTNSGAGGWVAGRGTTAQAIFDLVGLTNAAAQWQGHNQVEIEEVLLLDPDWLILSAAPGEAENRTYVFLQNEPRIQTLRALREERFLHVDGTLWASNTHHLLEAAEIIGEQLVEQLGEQPNDR